MTYTEFMVFVMEMVGTIPFASSGAMVGIKKNMDIFGVNVLGITTAIGGGIIRDLILGITPPSVFRNYIYVTISILISCILFLIIYIKNEILSSQFLEHYEQIMILFDAIGLGIFTVVGINTAINMGIEDNIFLLTFVGVVTGIGGGMIRDIMAGVTPFVLVKHVYASASIIGAISYILFIKLEIDNILSMVLSSLIVIAIRIASAKYKWNLPKIKK